MAESEIPYVYYSEDNPRRRPHRTAESETSNEYMENNTRRRPFQQNVRPPHTGSTGRGRGRARVDPHVMKAIHIFGVRDLRELLNQRHQEDQLRGGPPADPSYSYLSDPEREDSFHHQQKGHPAQTHQESPPSRGPRGRGNSRGRGKSSFIQNPLNIKVQFSTSTGERNYTVDKKDTLHDIRHVPDDMYSLQPFAKGSRSGGGNWRGRPREPRGRGSEERGRGGERMGRGRGRGLSARGRGGQVGDGPELRAKSVERSNLYDNEGKEYKARGWDRYGRSRSVEAKGRVDQRGEREGRDVEWESRGRRGSARGRGQRRGRGKSQWDLPERKTQIPNIASEQYVDAEENLEEFSQETDVEWEPRGRGGRARERGQRRGRGKRQWNPPEIKTKVSDIAAEQYVDAEENVEESSQETDGTVGDEAGSLLLLKEKAEMKKEKSVNKSSNRVSRKRSVRFNLKDNETEKAGVEYEKKAGVEYDKNAGVEYEENSDDKNECLEQESSKIHSQDKFVDSNETTKGENYDTETKEEIVNGNCKS